MPVITLPDPSLILLIGISGCGKSTFAKKQFKPTQVISSDHCRALLCDDENDQSVTLRAFRLVHHIVRDRLYFKKLTVVDATNVQTQSRRPLLELASIMSVPPIAFVFDLPEKLCLERNYKRKRVVDPEVIHRQYRQFQYSLTHLQFEGFQEIVFFRSVTEVKKAKFNFKQLQTSIS